MGRTKGIGYDVSIHAPVLGATEALRGRLREGDCFNPRTRIGCDRTKGIGMFDEYGFNPRTRIGCDISQGEEILIILVVSIHAPVLGAT